MMFEESGGGGGRALRVLIVVLLAGAVAVGGALYLARWAGGLLAEDDSPAVTVADGIPVQVTIPRGASARTIASLLEEANVVASARSFETAVREAGVAEQLGAGTYDLSTGLANEAAIAILLAGPAPEDVYRITVREGLRIEEVLTEIADQTSVEESELSEALVGGLVDSPYVPEDGTELAEWEGLLFPDTYEFSINATGADILQRLADTMVDRIDALDWTEFDGRGFDRHDALVMASIIEAETRVDADRPLVASVMFNRLEMGMPLQIDATILYALGERGIGLTLADLEIDSPYNTYQNNGLPPTPIGAPGRASLDALVSAPDTDYLYYVLTSADGSHSFTANYDEFLDWKAKAKAEGLFP